MAIVEEICRVRDESSATLGKIADRWREVTEAERASAEAAEQSAVAQRNAAREAERAAKQQAEAVNRALGTLQQGIDRNVAATLRGHGRIRELLRQELRDIDELTRGLEKNSQVADRAARARQSAIVRAQQEMQAASAPGRSRVAGQRSVYAPAQGLDIQAEMGAASLGVGGLAASFGLAAVGAVRLIESVVTLRDDLEDLGARAGVTSEVMAGLRFAAAAGGGGMEEITQSFQALNQRLRLAMEGNEQAAAAFAALGVSITDATGDLRPAEDVLSGVITALQAIEDPTQRAVAATSVLGESGAKLLATFGDTGRLDGYIAQARLLGTDVGPKAAEETGRWQRATAELGLVFEGLTDRVGGAILAMSGHLRNFSTGVVYTMAFVPAFVDEIMYGIERTISNFAAEFGPLLGALASGNPLAIAAELAKLGAAGITGQLALNTTRDLADSIRSAWEVGTEMAGRTITQFLANRIAIEGTPGDGFVGPQMPYTPPAAPGADAPSGGGTSGGRSSTAQDLSGVGRQVADPTAAAGMYVDAGVLDEPPVDPAAVAQATADKITSALGAIEGVASGSLGAIGALAGPLGAAIGGALDLAPRLRDLLPDLGDTILGVLQSLPDLISRVIPEFLAEFPVAIVRALPDIITGLIGAIPELVVGIVRALIIAAPEIVKVVLLELPQAIGQALVEALGELFEQLKAFVRDLLTPGKQDGRGGRGKTAGTVARVGAAVATLGVSELAIGAYKGLDNLTGGRLPGFATGTRYVDRTGLAVVHQGEAIDPDVGRTGNALRRGGAAVVVNVNGPLYGWDRQRLARDLVDLINPHLGARGSRLSWAG